MKRISWLLVGMLLLCGCAGQQTVETVTDELMLQVMTPQKELSLKLPSSAASAVMAAEDGAKLYFCDDYVLTVQTVPAGDLDRTVRTLCGYSADKLTLLQTKNGGAKRYDWTWTSAGEGSVQVGRGAVLDDGDHHYCVTVMADESACGGLDGQWDALFSSLGLQY